MPEKTHHENFDIFLKKLNDNNIRFVIIRGFRYLPDKADTDLDTVIHPEDWKKYKKACEELIKSDVLGYKKHGSTKKYGNVNNREMIYYPVFTKGTKGEHLPNKSFRVDSYSDLFFFGESKGKIMPLSFLNYVFENRKKINNYYVPDNISNIILLICRNIYDKKGNWNASGMKHRDMIQDLLPHINENKFNEVSNIFFNKNQNIYQMLKDKKYESIKKPSKMLFIVRKAGMTLYPDAVQHTQNCLVENNYTIEEHGLLTIKDKKEFLKGLYNEKMDIKEFNKTINESNENTLYYFITNYSNYKLNSVDLKNVLRKKYPNKASPSNNYFHSSDNIDDAYREIDVLKSNSTNFKGLGTLYTQASK